ncbi:MAG: hypothetical protein AUI14_13565 [Actinobacteria bacterium 13_2_20CM_2_71_6]|nr:MAG: hypothetical protein AUI14_13565 [Actinobacteria bacterium 13_2_20CM_2_71_6]
MRRWAPTHAFGRAVLVVGVLVGLAMVLGRADLVVLATPFALGAALGIWRRPSRVPVVRVSTGAEFVGEGGEVPAGLSVANPDEVPYDLVVLRTAISPWLVVPEGDRPYVTTVAPGAAADLDLRAHAVRWGRPAFGPAVAHAVAADGLLVSEPGMGQARRVKVSPVTDPFEATDSMPRAAGLVGAHHSRRPGEGGELAGVRMFAPGDRLRRIDWRVSLRTRELHVAATLSDRDAEVVLVLDILHEAGRSGGIHGARSVLDTTVRAAAGIAEHYLHRGDRVSLLEYGFRARRLRTGSGRRQYHTVLEWLLGVSAAAGGFEPAPDAFGPHTVSTNALVVVLTPLLDVRAAQMIARFARAGRFVVGVDTLPADLPLPVRRDWSTIAGRLWRLERTNILEQLREHGVPVVAWAGAGSLDEVLRQVSRMASAPKAVLR